MMSLATAARLDSQIEVVRTATRMKEFFMALEDTAADTGYDFDFLNEVFREALEDGEDFREALISVITIAYELDF